jgi:hypothetical protein
MPESRSKRKRTNREADLYPGIERWMKRYFKCFKTGINIGLLYSQADVLGIRDVGGALSGEIESIIIEVKRGGQPFATASGQALGYRVYANRVYLADQRIHDFSPHEMQIASNLGIGLIQIKGGRCREILSSPHHLPITRMSLELLEKLALGLCRICGTLFQIGASRQRPFSLVARSMKRAVTLERPLIFWNTELHDRKKRSGLLSARRKDQSVIYERRYLCSDCIEQLFAPALPPV